MTTMFPWKMILAAAALKGRKACAQPADARVREIGKQALSGPFAGMEASLAHGTSVLIGGRDEAQLQLAAAEIGGTSGKVRVLAGDISSKQTHYRGDNSYETDMARPFRISHRGGRGQDFDRFVSVR